MQVSSKAAKRIFLLSAVVLLGLSVLLYQQIHSLLASQDQLNRANLLKLKLEQLLGSLIDTETAQRGFLLSGDSLFLGPYYGAYERSKKLLGEIRDLTGENEKPAYNALQTFVAVRFGTFTHLFSQFADPALTPALRQMHLRRTKAVMDSIRYYVQGIEAKVDAAHRHREQENRKYNFLTPFYAVLLMVFAVAILVFSYERILGHLKRTQKLLYRLKKLNNKLKHKNHQLALSNKELDSFTYIASHDLKEPLRKILTYTSMIEQGGGAAMYSNNQLHFEKIKFAADRMQNLLNDLLYYSHTSSSEKKFEAVDLNKIVAEVVQNLDEEIAETGATIRCGQLPEMKGFPFQIKQLLENLLSNSLKYRQEAVRPEISISGEIVSESSMTLPHHKVSSRYLKISYRDNGLGFDQSYAERIFRLFQRLHSSGDYEGTGIGLTICKKVVDNHNGAIRAISEVNKGTTFEIYFPA